jgi:hypothetical protein
MKSLSNEEIVASNAVIIFKTYDGFINPEMAVHELLINGTVLTYRIYSQKNEIEDEIFKNITMQNHDTIINVFNENHFMQLNNSYIGNLADVGNAQISIMQGNLTKTVTMEPYSEPYIPASLLNISRVLLNLSDYVFTSTLEEAESIASDFIKESPTYSYDGSDLQLINYSVIDNKADILYMFISNHSGYGDRQNQTPLSIITQHTIIIQEQNNKIISAIIDGEWDELNQSYIQVPGNTNLVEVSYHPKQCETTPWDQYYTEGNINFIKEPTEPEIATAYFANILGINIKDFKKVDTGNFVCMTCDVCPTSYYYTMYVLPEDALELADFGWIITENAPDFQKLGFPDLLQKEDILPQEGYAIETGSYTVKIPEYTFTDPVEFEILSGNPLTFQSPPGEKPILCVAFKIIDTDSGQLIGKFNKRIQLEIEDPNVRQQSSFYNILPDGTYLLNTFEMEASPYRLSHPITDALTGWMVTNPNNESG